MVDITGPLKILEGEALSLYLLSITEDDINDMRDTWDEYSSRPGMFDAELVEEE